MPRTIPALLTYKFHIEGTQTWLTNYAVGFNECSGLEDSSEVVEYRTGIDASSTPQKYPGKRTTGQVELKRAVLPSNSNTSGEGMADNYDTNSFAKWRDDAASENGTYWEEELVVTVYSGYNGVAGSGSKFTDSGKVGKEYSVFVCWPSTFRVDPLSADGTDILYETLVLEHQGVRQKSDS